MSRHMQCHACHAPQYKEAEKDKPVKTKNVLDIRIVPGNPNNAWIECYENTYDLHAKIGNAEQNAYIESIKLQHHFVKKENKLKSFQADVKRRVAYLQNLKRQEEQRKSLKMTEDENNLVLQRTLGVRIPYRGNAEDLQVLNKELLKSCIIPCNNDKQLLQNEVEKSDQKVDEIAEEIKSENLKARSKLLLKRLETYETSLPGGSWKSPSQKQEDLIDSVSVIDNNKLPLAIDWPNCDTWLGKNTIQSSHHVAAVNKEETIGKIQSEHDCQIQHDPDLLQSKLNIIYSDFGKDVENEKLQKQNQYWKYRKIFMDIERDQVKENKKRKDHRKKVQHLKLVKEEERKLVERKLTTFPEKTINNIEKCSNVAEKTVIVQENKRSQETEMYRYMEALRKVAKERIKFCNVSIPPLCSCGPSFWDSHPDNCANNCIFYKNINVYVAALTSALSNTR